MRPNTCPNGISGSTHAFQRQPTRCPFADPFDTNSTITRVQLPISLPFARFTNSAFWGRSVVVLSPSVDLARSWNKNGFARQKFVHASTLMGSLLCPTILHGIVRISDGPSVLCKTTDTALIRPPRSLGSLVSGFKSACTTRINQLRRTPHMPVWQRNYFERVIREVSALERARRYIRENPARWQIRG